MFSVENPGFLSFASLFFNVFDFFFTSLLLSQLEELPKLGPSSTASEKEKAKADDPSIHRWVNGDWKPPVFLVSNPVW